MEEMVQRTNYLKILDDYRNQDAVKVLIGMRRVGKSTILRQFVNHLREEGVEEKDVMYVDMESLKNASYSDGMSLYDEIMSRYEKRKMYIFLDEVQLINGWERVVNSIKGDIDCDVYISGSNAYLLSSDISTLITGRSISITILPLSLPEYLELGLGKKPRDAFITYSKYGGLPFIRPGYRTETVLKRIDAIKSDIILKDICNRKKVDPYKVHKVVDYLFGEIGNNVSIDTISEELKMSTSTVSEYLDLITDSMMFMKVERYDLKGRNILKSLPKYYCTDLGMRATQPLSIDEDFGHRLENIVYLELIRRGKKTYAGKLGGYEVDFVTINDGSTDYYQVAWTLTDPKVMEREIRPFRQITGRGERFLITYDDVPRTETQDAIIINIVDFLMEQYPDINRGTPEAKRFGAYMSAYEHLMLYEKTCSKIMHTAVTFDNFQELSDSLQECFFDMQSAFKNPMMIDDEFMQDKMDKLVKIEVNIFDAMMTCANRNRHSETYKPVSIGDLENLTQIGDDISHYIGGLKNEK